MPHNYTTEQIDALIALAESMARRYPDEPPLEEVAPEDAAIDRLYELHEMSDEAARVLREIRGYV